VEFCPRPRLTKHVQDEGHRIKNCDSKTFDDLAVYKSKTRFLLTGTPLQNNMKELYSLINFLYPAYFNSWEAFDAYFNFDDIKDEQKTRELIEDESQHGRIKKVHFILHSLMLRRVKADVLKFLPKKREYILYAPMTQEQLDLYSALTDKNVNARKYLEEKVAERMTEAQAKKTRKRAETALPIRESPRKGSGGGAAVMHPTAEPAKNAFSMMMAAGQKRPRGKPKKNAAVQQPTEASSSGASSPRGVSALGKRKATDPAVEEAEPKSSKTSRESTPAQGRSTRARKKIDYAKGIDDSDLEDDEFERRLVEQEEAKQILELEEAQKAADFHLADNLELARKFPSRQYRISAI
jgi:ATP-dependent DNA helicase